MSPQRRRWLRIILLFGTGLGLRVAACSEFHAPAGDGHEYHKLAHEWSRARRYSYGPDLPLSYGRSPGWPIVLSLVDRAEDDDMHAVLVRGTRLNILFDAFTAFFLLAMALEAGLGERVAWLSCGLALFCPLLMLDCAYILRESLATALTTATVYFLVRALFRREGWSLVAAGALSGASMLVRFDAIAVAVAFLPPLIALRSWKHRIAFGALSLVAAAAIFSPWMIRNQIRFGDPHPAGAVWNNRMGDTFPGGARDWMRTWIDGLHQGWPTFRMTYKFPVRETDIDQVPSAYDRDPAQRKELLDLFQRYNDEGLSPSVDAAFRALADRRARAHPFRVYVALPLWRGLLWWWNFTPNEEQPMVAYTLGQPEGRVVFKFSSFFFFITGLVGSYLLIRRREYRWLAIMIGPALIVRTLMMAYAAPDGCQRFVAPVYPLLLLLSAIAIEKIRARPSN